MIRKTLAATQASTFAVELPNPKMRGMPSPAGTGFFVSPDGYFVTAAHVVSIPTNVVRADIHEAWLMKESRGFGSHQPMCQWPDLVFLDYGADFALLKVDWERNRNKDWLRGLEGFPHLHVSTRELEEGEPTYSFGYPLPLSELLVDSQTMKMSHSGLAPRVTSAIVASTLERTAVAMSPTDTKRYVLDKALNYGNSGGPIVAEETGHVHAFCSRFQPVKVPQLHLQEAGAPMPFFEIPSLYGVAIALSNRAIVSKLQECGVPLREF